VVDASGAVRAALPPGRAGTLEAVLQRRTQVTAYARWGELPLLLLAAAGIAVLFRSRVRQV